MWWSDLDHRNSRRYRSNGCTNFETDSLISVQEVGASDYLVPKQAINNVLDIMCLIADDDWPFRHMGEQDRNVLRSKIEEVRREADAIERVHCECGR